MISNGADAREFRGLSTDSKPSGDYLVNGSIFIEMDTKKVFVYNKDNKEWLEF